MKNAALLLGLLVAFSSADAAEIKDLILPGATFGSGWELTQPNIVGSTAAPNYVNCARTNQPMVIVNIIAFPSAQAAKEKLEKKFGSPEAKQYVKKLEGLPESYEQTLDTHRKRFVLINHYWLTVEQIADEDDRSIFIKKYTEHLKKNAKS